MGRTLAIVALLSILAVFFALGVITFVARLHVDAPPPKPASQSSAP